jgi:hypothetical protein
MHNFCIQIWIRHFRINIRFFFSVQIMLLTKIIFTTWTSCKIPNRLIKRAKRLEFAFGTFRVKNLVMATGCSV